MVEYYQEVIDDCIDRLSNEIGNLRELMDLKPEWSEILPLPRHIPRGMNLGKQTGVYRIHHLTDNNKVYYVGMGVITQRRSRIKMIFRNDGDNVIHSGGGQSDHVGARKCYTVDPNMENWGTSWVIFNNQYLMERYEVTLVKNLNPEFNLEGMSGK